MFKNPIFKNPFVKEEEISEEEQENQVEKIEEEEDSEDAVQVLRRVIKENGGKLELKKSKDIWTNYIDDEIVDEILEQYGVKGLWALTGESEDDVTPHRENKNLKFIGEPIEKEEYTSQRVEGKWSGKVYRDPDFEDEVMDYTLEIEGSFIEPKNEPFPYVIVDRAVMTFKGGEKVEETVKEDIQESADWKRVKVWDVKGEKDVVFYDLVELGKVSLKDVVEEYIQDKKKEDEDWAEVVEWEPYGPVVHFYDKDGDEVVEVELDDIISEYVDKRKKGR